ncbi:MAG: hypothetical protein IIB56_11205 [Planctomycetes bacterium]|nr:hypothetical protein [Planctomycetota bacterium]MCH8120754.1 hypothetical protein [Planctomycetota bacterium]
MTIQFFCPNCNEIIGFADKHSGKRARCTNCGQLFIIPTEDYKKPKKVELPKEKGEPMPGFYRAVFVDNWKLFFNSENVTSLVFVIAAVCFKFFTAGSPCCAFVTNYAVWGWLLGFYLNIIYETAFEIEKLPEIYLGTSITFVWYIIKPFFLFSITMAVVQLPFIITLILFKDEGLTFENIRQAEFGFRLLLQVLFILGLFLFPIAILTTAIGKDITMFRPDYFLAPVFKAFVPYVVTVVLLIAAALLETQTTQYTHAGLAVTAGHLILNLAVQVIAIIAMRSIGLFYRHYNCHLAW